MNQQQLFESYWAIIESGNPLTVEVVGGIVKVLWKENNRYFLSAADKKVSVSRRRARTEIHNMVARLLDERKTQEKREREV
ncbi:MAG: hypothetical protein AAB597_02810 [Patescibacteria group bacterium]